MLTGAYIAGDNYNNLHIVMAHPDYYLFVSSSNILCMYAYVEVGSL